ncbi:MAG: Na+-dependent transporter [Alphaproteobacteria bacterium]|nr:MAG: Na+-dependent transporter [Alphaproteobacteria bacterium]
MPLLAALAAALSWLGRQGTRAVAASIFIGIMVPPLAALLKPVFAYALFVLLCLAFLRVDPTQVRAHFARPTVVAGAAAWMMLGTPLLIGFALVALGIADRLPGLYVAMILQAAAPPVISAPTLAALMGLDAALSLATLIVCTAVTPFTAPVFATLFVGPAMTISPVALGAKLLGLLAGAALVAWLVRRFAGKAWVARQSERIDGLSVVALFVFAVALMDGVLAAIVSEPLKVLGLTLLSFALSLGLAALTALVFARLGMAQALALGLAAGNRNMGLMLAAAGAAVPDLTWLYFAVAQFPIYLMPAMLKPLARRVAPPP